MAGGQALTGWSVASCPLSVVRCLTGCRIADPEWEDGLPRPSSDKRDGLGRPPSSVVLRNNFRSKELSRIVGLGQQIGKGRGSARGRRKHRAVERVDKANLAQSGKVSRIELGQDSQHVTEEPNPSLGVVEKGVGRWRTKKHISQTARTRKPPLDHRSRQRLQGENPTVALTPHTHLPWAIGPGRQSFWLAGLAGEGVVHDR
jgi:hypothetical protein